MSEPRVARVLRPRRGHRRREGEPGHRLFFLQVSQARSSVMTLKMEKVQVAALAAWIGWKTLEDLPAPGHLPDALDLQGVCIAGVGDRQPRRSYDIDSDRIVLVAPAVEPGDELSSDEESEGPGRRLGLRDARCRDDAGSLPRGEQRLRWRSAPRAWSRPADHPARCAVSARPQRPPVLEDERLPASEPLTALSCGEIEVEGRMPWSSNATFRGTSGRATRLPPSTNRIAASGRCGTSPTASTREVAAPRGLEALGWGLVPETVLRDDAPMGIGSLQRFVDADFFDQHYFTLVEEDQWHDELQRIAVFDLIINNVPTARAATASSPRDGSPGGLTTGCASTPNPNCAPSSGTSVGMPIPPAPPGRCGATGDVAPAGA